ncbi:hypothetical protein WN51_12175 [Melipona quadrifasciata]|uniref:Uncharacterized protein n=1 Tax=Melipona quadrifasciata TaxID=166423 RepID=A0A0N0BGX7_9HYME|nr:hypothetical protein WN51_12175 [Melipona quadrifasciata]
MMFCCLRNCFNGLGFAATQTQKRQPNPISLDTSYMVDDGAILDLILDNFTHPPPTGFEKIMLEQSLL